MERVSTDSDWDVLRVAPYDDTTWIHESWRKSVRRALFDSAEEDTRQQDTNFTPPATVCRVIKNSNRGAGEELQYHDRQAVLAWITELGDNEPLLISHVNWLRMQRDLKLSVEPLADDLFEEMVRADISVLSDPRLIDLLRNPIALFDLANVPVKIMGSPEPGPMMWCDAKITCGEFHSLFLGAGNPRITTGNQDVEIRLGTACIRGIAKWEIDKSKPERFVMFQFPIGENAHVKSGSVSARDLIHRELCVRVGENSEYRSPDNSKSFPLTASSDDSISSSWTSASWEPEALRNATVTIEVCSNKQKAKISNITKPRKTSKLAIYCQLQHVITRD